MRVSVKLQATTPQEGLKATGLNQFTEYSPVLQLAQVNIPTPPPLPRLDLQSKMLQTIKHSIRVDKNKVKKLGKMFKFKKNISNVL